MIVRFWGKRKLECRQSNDGENQRERDGMQQDDNPHSRPLTSPLCRSYHTINDKNKTAISRLTSIVHTSCNNQRPNPFQDEAHHHFPPPSHADSLPLDRQKDIVHRSKIRRCGGRTVYVYVYDIYPSDKTHWIHKLGCRQFRLRRFDSPCSTAAIDTTISTSHWDSAGWCGEIMSSRTNIT